MVDFVLSQDHPDNLELSEFEMVYCSVHQYATFLNTPLNLSMFVPCVKVGDKWEVLEDKGECSCAGNADYCHGCNSLHYHCDAFKESEQYQKAKENLIFEGFDSVELVNDNIILTKRNLKDSFHISCTIEMLLDVFFLTLTEQGMIKSGLNNK